MARLPRLTAPGHLHHVIQRGNNRQAIFASVDDYQVFLALLTDHAAALGVAVHAYALLGNQFHLLATPSTVDGLPLLMQAVSRRYVRHFNTRHGRSGTLWEGRYRSTLIDPAAYLLACMVLMDLSPVAAGLAASARDYAWSSHGHYVGLRTDKLVTPHPLFWALGNTPFAREAAYAELVREGLSPAVEAALTRATLSGWALGDENFVAGLEKKTGRRTQKAAAGRPAASTKNAE